MTYLRILSYVLAVILPVWGVIPVDTSSFSTVDLVGFRNGFSCLVADNKLFCLDNPGLYSVETNGVAVAVCEGNRCFALLCDGKHNPSNCSLWKYVDGSSRALVSWSNVTTNPTVQLRASSNVLLVVDASLRQLYIYVNDYRQHELVFPAAVLPSATLYDASVAANGDVLLVLEPANRARASRPLFELLMYRSNGHYRWGEPTMVVPLEIPLLQPSPFLAQWASTMYVMSEGKLLSYNLSSTASAVELRTELTLSPKQTAQLQLAAMMNAETLILQYSSRLECYEVHRYNGSDWSYAGSSCGSSPIREISCDGSHTILSVLRRSLLTSWNFAFYILSKCGTSVFDCISPRQETLTTHALSTLPTQSVQSTPQASSSSPSTPSSDSTPYSYRPSTASSSLSKRLQTMLIIGGVCLFAVLCTVGLLIYRYHRTRSQRFQDTILVSPASC